ncbi:membrane protein [Arsukibacterium ikkense]|uniref:Membrane protein n=1 Tax=Arsukibacterium ikkense TaxID=336831 RepID=A0A0M2V4V1_9GAMM|nr:LemA family protein [Arsukibacterium ikkense]KKO45892.1 membrane protein [Arsukibacterium ikkense]
MATGIIIGIVALLAVLVVVIYNGIITRKNAVERGWANVITQERQKNKMIPHLEQVVAQFREYESGLQTQITELRSGIARLDSNNIDASQLQQVESSTQRLMQGLNIAVEAYPELKASDVFNNLMREIAEQQENIGAAIRIFNQNVEDFNNGIQVFPNALVNASLNKQSRITPFNDSEAEAGFEYKLK